MADGGHFEKNSHLMATQKACGHDKLWIVGWIAFKFGISDDVINFWDESIKNKMAAAAI